MNQLTSYNDYEEFATPEPESLGNGYTTPAIGCGKVNITTRQSNGEKIVVWMTDVLYVPKLTNSLFSVHAATSKGNSVLFRHTHCCIRNKHGKVIGTRSPSGKLYLFDCETHQIPTEKATVAGKFGSSTSKIDLWHQRLAQINGQQLMQQVKRSEGVDLGSQGSLSFCEACVQGKCHRKSHHSTKRGKPKEKIQLIRAYGHKWADADTVSWRKWLFHYVQR